MTPRSHTAALALLLLACQASAEPGATCTRSTDCGAPLVCRYARCRAECATNRDCGSAQSCIFSSDHSGVCQLDLDLGCEGGVGRECPAGLLCANDRCINPCTDDSECPSDGACRFSPPLGARVCVDPGRVEPTRPDAGVPVESLCTTITDVCVGDAFACAVRDGHVHCWGDDGASQHGDLFPGHDYTASMVLGPDMAPLDGIVAVECGRVHACARNAAGDVLCWGSNGAGQLSNDGAPDTDHASYVHVDVTDAEWAGMAQLDADQLVLGGDHSFAHRRARRHWAAWGQNADGELRTTGTLGFSVTTATYAPLLDDVLVIGVGVSHSCAATATGLSCVGLTANEELGDPSLTSLAGVTDLALGLHHSCALTASGVICWGSDGLGQLGDGPADPTDTGCGSPPCSYSPRSVALANVARLVHGSDADTSCALTTDGALWCWGENTRGQVDATLSNAPAPIRQAFGAFVCDAGLSARTVCALVAEQGGTVYCWGENGSGQLGILPDGETHAVPLRVPIP